MHDTREAPEAPRVLRLSPYYYLADRHLDRRELQYEPVGGMQVQVAQTTEELDALNVPQTVLLPRRPGQPGRLALGRLAEARLLRLPLAPIRTRAKGYAGLLIAWGAAVVAWCCLQRVRGRHHRWKVVHVHCSELPWTFLVAIAAGWILRRPVVLTIHCSAIFTCCPESIAGRLLIGPARAAERYALARASVVIVLTERIRRAYVDAGLVEASRVRVIPDGVRLERFYPPSRDGRVPAAGTSQGSHCVLYCGRLAPEKGWYDFVAAADILVNQYGFDGTFLMCGAGNELPHCQYEIEHRSLAGRVRLLGHLDRPEIAALMRIARIVVVPSRHEECGGTVLEALATGRAVVATRVGGLPELVRDGETGLLVQPRQPDQIAAAVSRLWQDSQTRRRLGRAGRARMLAFDARAVSERLNDVYHEVSSDLIRLDQSMIADLPALRR